MKGQLTSEYLISFVIFIGLIAYTYFSYSSNIPRFIEEVRKENIRSEAFQLSELLVNNPGEPINWQSFPIIQRIGISDENFNKSNLISEDKINELNTRFDCNNPNDYTLFMSMLGANRNFSLIISEIDLTNGNRIPMYTCLSPTTFISPINITIQRIVAYNDSVSLEIKPAEVIIQM